MNCSGPLPGLLHHNNTKEAEAEHNSNRGGSRHHSHQRKGCTCYGVDVPELRPGHEREPVVLDTLDDEQPPRVVRDTELLHVHVLVVQRVHEGSRRL